MSPISPFLMGGGQNNWPEVQNNWPEVPIPDYSEKCPDCGGILVEVHGTIGGFPGHEHIHPSSIVGYRCSKCNRYFPLGEFLLLKEKRARKKTLVRNYREDIRAVFLNPCLYIIVVGFMLLSGFWAGIVAGIAVVLLMPFLTTGLRALEFSEARSIGEIRREKKSGPTPFDKPPDNPQTP